MEARWRRGEPRYYEPGVGPSHERVRSQALQRRPPASARLFPQLSSIQGRDKWRLRHGHRNDIPITIDASISLRLPTCFLKEHAQPYRACDWVVRPKGEGMFRRS